MVSGTRVHGNRRSHGKQCRRLKMAVPPDEQKGYLTAITIDRPQLSTTATHNWRVTQDMAKVAFHDHRLDLSQVSIFYCIV